MPSEPSLLAHGRRLLLALFVFGVIGTLAELILLEHWEDGWQLVPLVALPFSLLPIAWYAFGGGGAAVRTFRVVMAAFLVAGLLGVWFHWRANVEWELESDPAIHGWPLLREAATGALPLLAPGTFVQFGLLGLLWTLRHPLLASARGVSSSLEA